MASVAALPRNDITNCYNKRVKNKAFTILEIVIAIAVILILAAAALQGSGGIIRSMRFNNAFNKLVLMVQKGRNLAIASRDTNVEKYEIKIDLASNTADLVKYAKSSTTSESIELLTFTDTSNMSLKAASDIECNTTAVATFLNGTSEPTLKCDASAVNTLKISLREKDAAGNQVREKTFSVNRLSGIPQLKLE